MKIHAYTRLYGYAHCTLARLPYPFRTVIGAILNPDPHGSIKAQDACESALNRTGYDLHTAVSSKPQKVQLARVITNG
jgi:hypothetical protein